MATHQRLLAARQRLRVLPVQGRPPGTTREAARSSRRATGRLMLNTQQLTLASAPRMATDQAGEYGRLTCADGYPFGELGSA